MRLALALAVALAASTARAQDRFEIQVYDAQTAPPGGFGLETHLNHAFTDADVDETHLTFEPHLGVAPWLEVGGYFQTAVPAGGGFDYAGVKLRAKVRVPERYWDDRVGLALNGELSIIPERYEPNVWGSELRPIIDLTAGRLYVSVNPIVTVALGGDRPGHPALEPAAKVAVRLVGTLAVGAEWYGAFGPIDDLGSESFSRLLGALDWTGRWMDLNLGAGYASGTADRWVVKMILALHPPED
jgi:hypothetical protein